MVRKWSPRRLRSGHDLRVRPGEDLLLIATDLDGTLLRRDGSLSDRTVAAIGAAVEAGVMVVLVTGRPPRWVDHIAAQLSCHPVAICSNGAIIYDAESRQVVAEHPIAPEVSRQVVEALRAELAGVAFAVEAGLSYGQEATYPNQWALPVEALIAEAAELVARPIAKLIVRHGEEGDHWELVERARQTLSGLVEVTSSGPGAPIEIAAPGVSKAFALEALAGQYGIRPGTVVAFGDMPNDLPMLAWAGTSVAPGDAHPDVLAVVDYVTEDCDKDGVAVFLERVLSAPRPPSS